MNLKSNKCKKIKNIRKVKVAKVKIKKVKGVGDMDRIVSTKTLFTSNEDYSKMNNSEKRNYVNKLSKEFIYSARDLLESLKDK